MTVFFVVPTNKNEMLRDKTPGVGFNLHVKAPKHRCLCEGEVSAPTRVSRDLVSTARVNCKVSANPEVEACIWPAE